jgi:hypothetical protein
MLEKSDSIKNLAIALRKTQEEIGKVNFDSTNPFLHNNYASLGAIIEASKAVLVKNGLSISQPTTGSGNEIGVTTILLHDSGEYIASTATIGINDEKGLKLAQVAGSIITYLRRYSLAAILNLYADEDNDANDPKKRVQDNQREEGYVPPVPKVQPDALPSAKMSIETANAIVNSEGVKYGDLDNNKLQNMANALQKAITLNKEPEQKITRQYKLDGIRTILMTRANDNPA